MRSPRLLLLGALLALTACVDTLADAILGDNGPPGRVDTLVIERPVPQPPDTIVCLIKHGEKHCWKL